MDLSLLKDGIYVMCIGMGTVFMFLVVLILAMNINSKVLKIVNKYFPEEVSQKITSKQENNDEEIALAVACAYVNSGKV